MDYKYNDNYTKQKQSATRHPNPLLTHAPHHDDYVKAESNRLEYLKFAGVLFLIILAATLMTTVQSFNWLEWMRWFMASFLIIFGSLKLIGYEMFVMMFPGYDPIAKRFKLYAYLYPFIQLFIATLYITNTTPVLRDLLTLVITGVGAWGVFMAVSRRDHSIRCACLGNIIKLPLSSVSLVEDLTMALMALVMLLSTLFI